MYRFRDWIYRIFGDPFLYLHDQVQQIVPLSRGANSRLNDFLRRTALGHQQQKGYQYGQNPQTMATLRTRKPYAAPTLRFS
jgi:hypothetical protein